MHDKTKGFCLAMILSLILLPGCGGGGGGGGVSTTTVTGTVTYQGVGVPALSVELRSTSNSTKYSAVTDVNGAFQFTEVFAGNYRFYTVGDEWTDGITHNIAVGQTNVIDIVLLVPPDPPT